MNNTLLLITVAAMGGGAWYYFAKNDQQSAQYQTAPLSRGDLTQAVTATGTLNPVVNVQIGSQISGNIQKVFVDFNSPVKEGQVIAQLDPATYQAVVHQSEGDVSAAQAALELAKINAHRQQELNEKKIAPPQDLDNAMAALHQAEATLRIKDAQLERAKVDLNRCTITAPIDGIVISRSVDVGQTVAASLQAPVIFTIANDLRNMQIDANVAEADVGNVEVGQAVDFSVDAFPYRTFHGKVAQVRNAPITVQNVVTYDTVISVTNDELKLKPGMTANVSIVIAQRENALKLPNAALRYRPPEIAASGSVSASPEQGGRRRPDGRDGASNGGSGGRKSRESGGPMRRNVYMLVNGGPQATPVKLGISDGITTEVLEGLKETDSVVIGTTQPSTPSPSASSGNPFGGSRRRF
jgi:HlyD family secretion protein